MKFDRRFKLLYELEDLEGLGNNKAIEISSPLTIEFDITRNTSSTLNSASFRLYNLNPTNRDIIYRNRTSIQTIRNRQRVVLKAGYRSFGNPIDEDSGLSTIFIGDLLEAYSYRQGTDIITYINAQDGSLGAYNSTISTSLNAGTSFTDVISQLASSIKGVTLGKIGETEGNYKTPVALNGNAFTLLTNNYKDQVFIDLEKIHKLDRNEYLRDAGVLLIDSGSGLLGTPLRQGTDLVVEMLFEPRVVVGQLVEIDSDINKKFNGQYKIMGLKHSGVISESEAGECKTTLQLYIGDKLLGDLKGV